MENLKEIIKGYIRENYTNEAEPDSAKAGDDKEFNHPDVSKARKYLRGLQDQRFLQSLTRIDSLEEAQALLMSMIEFINLRTPAPNLTKNTVRQAIEKAIFDDFIIPKDKNGSEEDQNVVQTDPSKPDGDEVEPDDELTKEVSTSAGAGSYNTKYAFRLKKQKDK